MGVGVGMPEVGYLYGQYKRTQDHVAQVGKGILWGGLQVSIIIHHIIQYIM
jgi:glutamate dehydrogenase (NADP+)